MNHSSYSQWDSIIRFDGCVHGSRCVCCVYVCAPAIHEASQVLSVLPDKEGPCLLCVCFLYMVVVVVCVWWSKTM